MTRLAIVGIDGATWAIIRPMMEAGELPNIARILREGVSGVLTSEKPPMTPPAWTSMFTGLNPGKHGVFHFIRRNLGTYDVLLNDSRNYVGKDMMSLLSKRGWSVGCLSVPMTYPPFAVHKGYMISGIPMPLTGDSIAWPPGMTDEMTKILGHPYEPDVEYGAYDGDTETPTDDLAQYAKLRDHLFKIERERLDLQRHLLKTRPTDFYFTVISVTDRCQHYFWKFQDPTHAGYTEEGNRLYGQVIQDAYRLADDFVGEVRAQIGDSVPVALVSDHGFGPQYTDFHINTWLEQAGFLVRKKTPRWTLGMLPLKHAFAKLGLAGVGKALGPLGRIVLVRPKRKKYPDMRDVVWSKTRAFATLHGICINRKDREPLGIVDGEEAYRQTVQEVLAALKKINMPDGSQAVDLSGVKEDIYTGPRTPEAPDIQFQMAGLSCVTKESWGDKELFGTRQNAPISGQHRFDGIFAYAGPQAKAGFQLQGMHIQDTSPTLLYATGEAVPKWMDGRIRGDIFENPSEPIWDDSAEPGANAEGAGFSDAESQAIEESLRGLGYIQ